MRELLPEYAADSLAPADRDRVEAHLAGCARCRTELGSWRAIAAAATPAGAAPDPARLVRMVLTRSALDGPASRPRRTNLADLVLAEARLIRLAVPVASALVMALGVALVLLQPTTAALSLVAPIVAAAGVAGTYRSARDPAAELVAAAPTSGRLLLLVRIALVFGYDLLLALAASAVLAVTGAAGSAGLDALVGSWLGPMALLSAVSLLVAVRFGPDIALGSALGLWAVRVLAEGLLAGGAAGRPARAVVAAWSTNAPVLAASVAIAVAAVAMAGRIGPFRGEPRDG
ncbi:zf-HC2 domain-containing protein [Dactylosporangium sp. CS-033363]|uniref:zf-HC2 domain-containing protein n=1 Tax=Dactylosporangium sp. CS-033363 TaxID=3239935 RepID=UPI003D8FAF5C